MLARVSMVGLKRMEQYVGCKKERRVWKKYCCASIFQLAVGGWKVDVYCTTQLKPTIFHFRGNFAQGFGNKLSTLRISNFPKYFFFPIFVRMGVDVYCSSISSCPNSQYLISPAAEARSNFCSH